ncbi:MAG: hypothetical protein ACLTYN_02785 [Dysosmobacter welbionis]
MLDRTPDTKAERASYRLLPRERAAGIAKLRWRRWCCSPSPALP